MKTIITQADLCHVAQRSMQYLLKASGTASMQRAAGEPRNEPPRKQRNRMTPCVTLAETARSATIVGRTVVYVPARRCYDEVNGLNEELIVQRKFEERVTSGYSL